jgi:glutathione peroxidase
MFSSFRIFFATLLSWINYRVFRTNARVQGSIYDFTLPAMNGEQVNFSRFRGKKLLLVNTASKCGLTPQLEHLQKLHEQYKDKITILGFPANDFLWQEPGSNKDIEEFCSINYGVTFQMFQKISVKGRNAHPLFKWLAQKTGQPPTWNFFKYLVSENGEVETYFQPKTDPLDQKIINKILYTTK